MRIAAAAIAASLFAAPAMAQQFEREIHYVLPTGGTFAVRALCPLYGALVLYPHLAGDFAAAVEHSGGGGCVNGRKGLSFTVPPGSAVDLYVGWDQPMNFRIRLEHDCGGNAATACTLPALLPGQEVVRASGRFTWPGDEDWYRLDDPLSDVVTTTSKDTCVAVARFERTSDDVVYLVLTGGPAGCVYGLTARIHPHA
jgi:hypothetical protein